MPNRRAVDDWNLQGAQDALADIADGYSASLRRLRLGEFAQHDAAHALEFSGLLEMQQHTIELIGFQSAILEQENRAARVKLPRRPERCFDKRDAAAKQNPSGRTAHQCFSAQLCGPGAVRRRHRAHERIGIVAASRVRACVKAASHERAVKSDPAELLPQKNVERGQIAERAKNLRLFDTGSLYLLQEFRAAVATTSAKDRLKFRIDQRIVEIF